LNQIWYHLPLKDDTGIYSSRSSNNALGEERFSGDLVQMARRRKARSRLPIVFIAVGLALIVGAAAWAIYLANRTAPAAQQSGSDSGAVSTSRAGDAEAELNIPYPDVPRVSLADAQAAFELGTAVFVDVRGDPFYSDAHIPGALNLTDEALAANLDQVDPEDWIITYCT
jgi:hypothetical protein